MLVDQICYRSPKTVMLRRFISLNITRAIILRFSLTEKAKQLPQLRLSVVTVAEVEMSLPFLYSVCPHSPVSTEKEHHYWSWYLQKKATTLISSPPFLLLLRRNPSNCSLSNHRKTEADAIPSSSRTPPRRSSHAISALLFLPLSKTIDKPNSPERLLLQEMAALSVAFLLLSVLGVPAKCSSSFSFPRFEKSPNFSSRIALFGDAEVDGVDSSIRVARPYISSTGSIFYRKPINFSDWYWGKIASFSTDFEFSVSPGSDGITFVVLPIELPLDGRLSGLSPGSDRFLAVEFNASADGEFHVGEENRTQAKIFRVHDVSAAGLSLNSGEKLHSRIDYYPASRKLEVRLTKSGASQPLNPLFSHTVDVSEIWKDEMFVGLSSSSRNSTGGTSVYSWSFRLSHLPHFLHSEPLDPHSFLERRQHANDHWSGGYLSRILTALIFGVGCGAALAVMVLFAWSVFLERRSLVQPECSVHPVDFEYEKIKVAAIKDASIPAAKK
ncbi:hypothetical protein ACLOJK_012516 [Asimina triloba]